MGDNRRQHAESVADEPDWRWWANELAEVLEGLISGGSAEWNQAELALSKYKQIKRPMEPYV